MALDQATYRVQCSGILVGSEVWANIWHVRSRIDAAASFDLGTAALIATLARGFYDDIKGLLTTTFTLDQVVVSSLGSPASAPFEDSTVVTGTSAADPIPTQSAV